MKRVLFIAVLALLSYTAQAQTADVQNFINVRGQAELRIQPNSFTLNITIDEKATKGKVSVESIEQKMVATLKKLGIDNKSELKLSNLSSADFKSRGALTVANYTLHLDSADMVATVVDELGHLGIESISLSEVTHSDIENYRREALSQSAIDARAKADIIAKSLNQEVGDCIQIYDRTNYYSNSSDQPFLMASRGVNMDESAVQAEPLEFRDIVVKASVDAKFLLFVKGKSSINIIR